METHDIDIEISPSGQVKLSVRGAKGPVCLEYAKLFENLLGEASDIERTSEYYEPPTGVEIHLNEKA